MDLKAIAAVVGVLCFFGVSFAIPAVPNCALVQCGIPKCRDGEVLDTPPGQCCPSCRRPTPINCALVRCAQPPKCRNGVKPYKPPGQCCSICPEGGCVHLGKFYRDGASFSDGCNKCSCRDGRAICTKKACLTLERPGSCPVIKPGQVGICVERCSSDSDCAGRKKCCSNGCGRVCTDPVRRLKGCIHNGKKYRNGDSFRDDCNTCQCSNGNVACTLMACIGRVRS